MLQTSGLNPDNANSATITMLQLGPRDHCRQPTSDDLRQSLLVDVLDQLISEPAFNTLRTEEQLGYVVSAQRFASALWCTAADGRVYGDTVTSLIVLVQGEYCRPFVRSPCPSTWSMSIACYLP